MPERSRSTSSRKLPEFSYIPFRRSASLSPSGWSKSAVSALVGVGAALQVDFAQRPKPASLVTRLITPPPPPRPKIIAFGPFSASTRSRLYRSR